LKTAKEKLDSVRTEVGRIVVGQANIVDGILRALLANGHVLVEGVPGIGKTLLARSLSTTIGCSFKRIQFTPDLLPSDLIGITTYSKEKGFTVVKGPIFANVVLGDEINRAPPKVQSALLEAMQERQATIGRETFVLQAPFFILATQNPLESLGVYPLPQAQVDRFLFKLLITYPSAEEEQLILNKNITVRDFSDYNLKAVLSAKEVIWLQSLTQEIYVAPEVEKYIVRLVDSTRRPAEYGLKNAKFIEYGCSPRASIGLYSAAKAQALMQGKNFVSPQNVKEVALDVLRHRIILNYEGQAENVSTDAIVQELLAKVRVP